ALSVAERTIAERPLLYVAALWDRWRDGASGRVLYSCTLLTTAATADFPLHHRMPVVLSPARARLWIDRRVPFAQCVPLLSPYRDHALEWYRVADTVNNVRNKAPECVLPLHVVTQRSKASGIMRFFAPAA